MEWIIVLAVVAVVAIGVAGIYNSLVSLRNRVKDSWAQIDVQLKRRFDLIPNLVNTVKGYAAHEKETLEAVINARNKFTQATTPAEEMESNNMLTGALSRLFALAESYPDLKANQNFLNLQDELSKTEDKISFARQFYNDTVLMYNNKVEMFPSNIVAGLFKFQQERFFEIDEAARETPNVQF
ncbi:LemA family protein [Alkalibacter rhizosphaerae]|uniref:LemA family protein n=1 Tax=Alkalibacter rhizosphaerae TaxID=2815577 RepID=A0A975AHN6_9FIRM|nr:LemA family protein [Alkalibacter rhizosphaerae]QSX08809.1 LemA family protein [Alkalibacter rhizosphaerae]